MGDMNWATELESHVERLMAADQLPGAGIGLAHNGKQVYGRGFGYRDREQGLPVTPDTVFGIGSVTKSFTCVAIMQLQEAGRLSVDDPVVRYIPEYSFGNEAHTKATTIHHFMTHTAGIPPTPLLWAALLDDIRVDSTMTEQVAKLGDLEPMRTLEQLPARLAALDLQPLGPPGAVFSYSNDAFALLGLIVERASGQSYADYMREHIIGPCGMSRTTLDVDELLQFDDVTQLYARKPSETGGQETVIAAPGWWQCPSMLAAGYLRASVPDMLRYLEIYRNAGDVHGTRVLRPESVAQMVYPHVEYEPGQHYGYGLQITVDYHGVTLIGHGGSLKGIQADVATAPEAGWSSVALTNLGSSPASRLMMGAMNCALGLPADTPRSHYPPYSKSPGDLSHYVGTYRSGEGAAIDVRQHGDGLQFCLEGKWWPSRPIGPHAFLVSAGLREAPAVFHPGASGPAEAVSFHLRYVARAEESS